jgi:hypothetical protein
MTLVNLAEYEEAARAKLRREAYDYYAGGANDEVTLRANREAYGRLALYHRVLREGTSQLGSLGSWALAMEPIQRECARRGWMERWFNRLISLRSRMWMRRSFVGK